MNENKDNSSLSQAKELNNNHSKSFHNREGWNVLEKEHRSAQRSNNKRFHQTTSQER